MKLHIINLSDVAFQLTDKVLAATNTDGVTSLEWEVPEDPWDPPEFWTETLFKMMASVPIYTLYIVQILIDSNLRYSIQVTHTESGDRIDITSCSGKYLGAIIVGVSDINGENTPNQDLLDPTNG